MRLSMQEVNNIRKYQTSAGSESLIDLCDTIEAQQQEIELLNNQNDTMADTINMLAPYAIGKTDAEMIEDLKQLVNYKQEIDRLHRWVSDLQRGIYVNCVYCGHRYGPEDEVPSSMADVLKEHIEHCPEHPMSKLKQEFAQLQEKLKYAEGAMEIEAFDARQLRNDVEVLAAQATIMREALELVEFTKDTGRIGGAVLKFCPCCGAIQTREKHKANCILFKALSTDAGKEYHNPADVELLETAKTALTQAECYCRKNYHCWRCRALEAIEKVLGGDTECQSK